jgi:hypothetical protein
MEQKPTSESKIHPRQAARVTLIDLMPINVTLRVCCKTTDFSFFCAFFWFFHDFSRSMKANQLPTAYIRVKALMRMKHDLAENVWYKVSTAINNREPVFQWGFAVVLFCRVLIKAKGKFPFETRGLVTGNERLSFYIRLADECQLPEITRWMMNISSLSRRLPARDIRRATGNWRGFTGHLRANMCAGPRMWAVKTRQNGCGYGYGITTKHGFTVSAAGRCV